MYSRILVPLDGSEVAERVLQHVEALTTKFGSAVMLLRVTTSAEALPPTPALALSPMGVPAAGPIFDRVAFAREEREEALQYLASLAEGLQKRGMSVTYEQREGNPAAVILEQAGRWSADLVAMTTHGRSGLGRLLLGSVAYDVVRSASCPVLLVRVSDDTPAQ